MILIVANGELGGQRARRWLATQCEAADLVIAANGGMAHLLACGCYPDVVVGDMDSLPAAARPAIEGEGLAVVTHPADKDETDLELALIYAIERGPSARPVRVAAALGGRLDQLLANVFLLAHPVVAGRDVRLVEPDQEAWLLRGEETLHGQPGDLVSLLPVGGPARIERTAGLAWPLIGETLSFGPARGVSNRMTERRASVIVSGGVLLCIHTKQRAKPERQDDARTARKG